MPVSICFATPRDTSAESIVITETKPVTIGTTEGSDHTDLTTRS